MATDPSDQTRFVGTELGTVELIGEIDRDAPLAAPVCAAGIVEVATRAELSVVFLAMRGLRSRRIAWPRFDYGEVLWRVGGWRNDEPVWVATRCDLDSMPIRIMARRLMRYDTHAARIAIDTATDGTRALAIEAAAGRLAVTVTPGAPITPPASRPMLVDGGAATLAWHEHPVGEVRAGSIKVVTDSLLRELGGEGRLDRAIVYVERAHACGIAERLP